MTTKQAKDFLVAQTVEEAALDGVPLSDVEKRMMYFTESDPASCENPIDLNDEFEGEYETKEYEAKISRLLYRAHTRLKKDSAEESQNWDRAVRTLREGDHYILVMVDQAGDIGLGWWMPVLWGVGISVLLFSLMMVKIALEQRGLIPSWVFGWISDDRATQKLEFELIFVGCVGLWLVARLAKLKAAGELTKTLIRGLLSPSFFSRHNRHLRK